MMRIFLFFVFITISSVLLAQEGTYDNTFNNSGAGFDGEVKTVVVLSDGKMLVGGTFSTYNGSGCPANLVRLNSNGTIDNTFNNGGAGFNNSVNAIAVQSDDKIVVGGAFTTFNGSDCSDKIVRLSANGALDNTFNNGGSGFDNLITAIVIQSNQKIVVGGWMNNYNGSPCISYIQRLNSDGTIDAAFNNGGSGFNGVIYALALQSDQKILAGGGGTFNQYNGSPCNSYIARLNTDGTNDGNFNNGGTGADDEVYSMAVQSDGKILIGGFFLNYDGNPCPGSFARLNSNGTLDENFNFTSGNPNEGFDDLVYAIAVQSDGKILVGGYFTTFNGSACSGGLIRVGSDGSSDNTFNNGGDGFNTPGQYILGLALQSDGALLACGSYNTYNGSSSIPVNMIRINAASSAPAAIVPTLGEWGLISLMIIAAAFGGLFVWKKFS